MLTYSFWNNKGGTGKTSLVFQTACAYAEMHPDQRILVIDLCPQANLSEILLGGQENGGNRNLLAAHDDTPRRSIGGYFEARLPSAYSAQGFNAEHYIVTPSQMNSVIPDNIDLICGDPLLELQANAMNTLANVNLPGVNTWLAVIDWLNDLLLQVKTDYGVAFIDTNPSFSMYTQIALAASERVILPVMADDSSRRAVQNALSLIYGIRLPSPVYAQYTFSTQMQKAGRNLPQIHLVVRNRITQYMGDASAYQAVLNGITRDLDDAITAHPQYFTFNESTDGLISVRDFQTTGVVSFALGCPFTKLRPGKRDLSGQTVQIKKEYLDNSIDAISGLATRI